MAATKRNAMLIEEARSKIQTTQLINRLQNHALGKVEMTDSQVRATAILLKKKLPDLQSVAHTGPGGEGPVEYAQVDQLNRDIDELLKAAEAESTANTLN